MDHDPFAFIDIEVGTISSSRRAVIFASPFINDDSPQALGVENGKEEASIDLFNGKSETNLLDMDILEVAATKGIHFDPPKWHRHGGYDVKKKDKRMPHNVDNDREKLPVQEQEQANPNNSAASKVPIDLLDVFKPLSQELVTSLETMNLMEIAAMKGIHFDLIQSLKPDRYDLMKNDKCIPLNIENDKEKMTVQEQEQANPNNSIASQAAIDILDVFKPLSQELNTCLETMNLMEIAAMKGIRFDLLRWHKPGGHDPKKNYKCMPLNFENDKEKLPVQEQEQANPNNSTASEAPIDLLDVFKLLSQELVTSVENMNLMEIAAMKGIRFDLPRSLRPGGHDPEKNDKCIPLNVEDNKEKLSVQEQEEANPNNSTAAQAPIDLLEVFKPLSQELVASLENMDLMDLAATKGIRFDLPRWHRPGGSDARSR